MSSAYPDPADVYDQHERDEERITALSNRIADDAADLADDGMPPQDAIAVADVMDDSDPAGRDAEIMSFPEWQRHYQANWEEWDNYARTVEDGVRAHERRFE